MELKRVLTKRMRIRKNQPPNAIDLPPSQMQEDAKLNTPRTPSTPAAQTAPATPTTPGTEEFVSIAFEDQPESPRAVRNESTRSSRSASVASASPATQPPNAQLAVPAVSTHAPALGTASGPASVEPISPASLHSVSDSDADEMAQQILDTVQRGGEKWSL